MENKSGFKKPLKPSFNKEKDLFNAYKKNEERVIPITEDDASLGSGEEIVNVENMFDTSSDANEELHGEIAILNTQLDDLTKERDELKEQLIRKAAEFENQRKRHLKEKQEMLDYANERLLFRMIELLDDLNSAVTAGNQSTDYTALLTGLEMIRNKAFKLFEEAGVKMMEDQVGKEFDVNYHEAMMMTPSELPEGAIVQTLQNGYFINEKVLRHARVITSAGKKD